MAMHGGILPFTGTFFVFLDYMRPPVRLAALLQGQGRLRLQPRLGRRRRGRPDAPAGRAPGDAAGDPRPAGDPARPTPTRPSPPSAPPSATTRARRRSCSPARACRCCTDGSAVERGAGIVADVDGSGAGHRRHRQRGVGGARRRQAAHGRRHRHPRRQPAELGPLRAQGPEYRDAACSRPACRCCRSRPATTFGWAEFADDSIGIDRFGVSAPGARCCSASASTSSTSWRRLARS